MAIGMMLLLASSMYSEQIDNWNDFTASVQAFPSYDSPFDEQLTTTTMFPDGPTDFTSIGGFEVSALTAFTGCANESFDRQNCINSNDRAASFLTWNFTPILPQKNALGLFFNLTDKTAVNIDPDNVRGWTLIVSCRTRPGSQVTPQLEVNALIGIGTGDNRTLTCPIGNAFVTSTVTYTLPEGAGAGTIGTNPSGFEGYVRAYNGKAASGPGYDMVVDVSYVRFEVGVQVASGGCTVSEDAWFPWADQVACAILNFGGAVWKGIQAGLEGFKFLGEIGGWIAGMALTFSALFTFLFAIPGLPDILQGIVDVILVSFIALFAMALFDKVRGGGGMGL